MQRSRSRVTHVVHFLSATVVATLTPGVSTASDMVDGAANAGSAAQAPQSAPNPPMSTPPMAQRTPNPPGDSAAIEKDLRKSIERFQNSWRKAWQKVEIKRHKPVNLNQIRGWMVQGNGAIEPPTWDGDRLLDNRTPDLRRYLAILCYVNTPTDDEIEAIKARTREKIGQPIAKAKPDSRAEEAKARGITSSIPRGVSGMSRVSFVTSRMIQPRPNNGAVCPSWSPAEENIPLDEGEAIDLAIPPEGRAALRAERDALIRQLENAHARFPMNDWIAGQRLRFVLDQRSPERSIEAARACRGTAAWCAALAGLALEQAGNVPEAEAAFRAADSLAGATTKPNAPCVDEETLLLFPGGDRDDVTRGTCDEQRTRVDRMWWLADPLWSVAGNERYVAHGSRRTHATLRSALSRDERYVWDSRGGGSAMRELIVRYGWPGYTYWPGGQFEEEMNKLREGGGGSVAVGYPFPPYTAKEYSVDRTSTIPSLEAINDPFHAKPSHWKLHLPAGASIDSWWPQEHMMLHTWIEPLTPGQQVQWRRDSAVVFALAVDNPLHNLDTAATGASLAMLMGSTGPGNMRQIATSRVSEGYTLRLGGEIASVPIVLSAEVQARSRREAAHRMRFGLHPAPALRDMGAQDVALSDPVFLRLPNRNSAVPSDMASVSALMAGDLTFARTEPLALYWESYGFPVRDSVELQLRVVRNDDVGLARRIGAAIGVASDLRDSIVIKWTEPDSRQGTPIPTTTKPAIGRAVALDIHALPEGSYIVSIEMRRGATMFARSERRFRIGSRE